MSEETSTTVVKTINMRTLDDIGTQYERVLTEQVAGKLDRTSAMSQIACLKGSIKVRFELPMEYHKLRVAAARNKVTLPEIPNLLPETATSQR